MVTASSYSCVQILVMFCITVRVPCSGFSAATDESERICEQLQCENNSSCRVRTENGNTQAECMCHDEWTGQRCEGILHLKTESVKSSSAVFSVSIQIPPSSYSYNSSANDDILSDFRFTVQYWTFNGSNFMCNILQDTHSMPLTILGLQSRTTYYVCAKSIHVDRCFPTLNLVEENQNLPPNCIIIVTQNSTAETENQDGPPIYAIPLSVALAVLLLVTIVLIVIFVKLKNGKGVCISYVSKRTNTRKRHCSSDTNPEILLLTATPPTPHFTMGTPSSLGKHKYKQSKIAGPRYTAFNAKTKERIALASVIEYTPEGAMEEPENEIMEMTTFRGREKLAVLNENQRGKSNVSV